MCYDILMYLILTKGERAACDSNVMDFIQMKGQDRYLWCDFYRFYLNKTDACDGTFMSLIQKNGQDKDVSDDSMICLI